MSPETAATEALEFWSHSHTLATLDERWAPQLLRRFAEVVRTTAQRVPEAARRSGLVRVARTILKSAPETQLALARDAALGRWTSAMERALSHDTNLDALLALTSRFAVGAALRNQTSLETTVILGSGGRARLPTDGRVLQGPPGRSVRVLVLIRRARTCSHLLTTTRTRRGGLSSRSKETRNRPLPSAG